MGENFAVLIAVERYADKMWGSVKFAEADAREMSNALFDLGYKKDNQILLINDDATKARIDSRLRRAVDALLEDDRLVIYYAGHGFSELNRNYLTCYDSEVADIVRTSIPLQEILDFVRSSESQKIILFLDCCHSGPVVREEDRGLIQNMDENQMRVFFRDAQYCACFSSCKTSEKSYPSSEYGHGIWTFHILQAIRGNDDAAIERSGLITSSSLQNYLARQVPLSVRKTLTSRVTQTPVLYGTMTKDFVVADVGPILKARRVMARVGTPSLKRTAFCSEKSLSVRSLSGFKKWHRVPNAVNRATTDFLNSISQSELEEQVQIFFAILKKGMKYTRKQLEVVNNDGAATIFTPDFSLEITLSLVPEDPSQVLLKVEMVNITNFEMLLSKSFNDAFAKTFDKIDFQYSIPFPLEGMIDSLEENAGASVHLDYPFDLSFCRVKIEGFLFEILISSERLRLEFDSPAPPQDLLEGLKEVSRFFLKYHEVQLLTP
jgi:hypothetical protein